MMYVTAIIAHAKSGTGKTLIFVLPILNDFVKRKPSGLQCLVLAPTREIAKQIYDVFRNVSSFIEGNIYTRSLWTTVTHSLGINSFYYRFSS